VYDHHSAEHAVDAPAIHADLRARCPVSWTESHGGFWVATSYDAVEEAARNPATFVSDHDIDGSRQGYEGITIPSIPGVRFIPSECDAPEFSLYRRLLNPSFAPPVIARWEPLVRQWTTECLDRAVPAGRLDLVLDLASPVAAIFTLAFVGLPIDDWPRYAEALHASVHTPPGTPEKAEAVAGVHALHRLIEDTVGDRLAHPRDDLVSHLAHADVDGVRIVPERVVELVQLVVAGGVDTTTALISNALHWLHHHPAERAWLAEDLTRIPLAGEEFLRYFTPTQATARTADADVSLAGVEVSRGQRVLLSWAAANRDPAHFDDPDEVRLDRAASRHVAFGLGPHRCIGSGFARTNFRIVMEEVLTRIPEYSIDVAAAERYRTIGVINGWVKLPATLPS
jgi:cytochrome P450